MKHYIDRTNNEIYAYEADGSQDAYIKEGLEQISDTALASLREQQEQDRPYSEKRAEAYPSLTEQLDMQYWDSVNGTTTWQDAILAIKAEIPKPQENN